MKCGALFHNLVVKATIWQFYVKIFTRAGSQKYSCIFVANDNWVEISSTIVVYSEQTM